jgi:hypothetical protein
VERWSPQALYDQRHQFRTFLPKPHYRLIGHQLARRLPDWGDEIKLTESAFDALFKAFFAEIETKFM